MGRDILEQIAKETGLTFQLTRPRGARRVYLVYLELRHVFQLTRPRGARRCARAFSLHAIAVSTHAPAWGATVGLAECAAVYPGFNSRARVGRDFFLVTH